MRARRRLSVDEYRSEGRRPTGAKAWPRAGIDGPNGSRRCATPPSSRSTPPARPPGVPLNVVGSLQAPPLSWETEAETLRDEIEGIVTSLLGLVGIAADPLASREHVLLANLVENAWRAGRDLDLGALIGEIQTPAAAQARRLRARCVLPAEGAHRARAEAERARRVAVLRRVGRGRAARSGGAAAAASGEKPRAAIVYLAHLSEEERQFVVTLVLSKVVTWMRGLPGTSDLRALVYMDEVVRLRPADGGAAGEEADPDDPQAGARVRRRHGARDPEPGRPRLQGDVERRHVARRPPADRARQGARPRRAALRGGRHRRRRSSTKRSAASAAAVPARQRARAGAGASSPPAGRCRTCAGR